jgi:hypothetical protein
MSESNPATRPSGGRFQPGRSGNPKGRPRKANTVGDAVRSALAAKVTINEGGKRKRITKQDAAATQWANKSASGDLRAAKLAFDMAQRAEDREAAAPSAGAVLTASDEAIVERLVARLRLIGKETANEPDLA